MENKKGSSLHPPLHQLTKLLMTWLCEKYFPSLHVPVWWQLGRDRLKLVSNYPWWRLEHWFPWPSPPTRCLGLTNFSAIFIVMKEINSPNSLAGPQERRWYLPITFNISRWEVCAAVLRCALINRENLRSFCLSDPDWIWPSLYTLYLSWCHPAAAAGENDFTAKISGELRQPRSGWTVTGDGGDPVV